MQKPLTNNTLYGLQPFPLNIIFPFSVQTFPKPRCSLAFLRCFILFRVKFSVTETPFSFKSVLFLKTWCLSLYRVNFTIIAHGLWPGPFRFPTCDSCQYLFDTFRCLVNYWWCLKAIRPIQSINQQAIPSYKSIAPDYLLSFQDFLFQS